MHAHQPAWLLPFLLSSASLTPKGSTPGTRPPSYPPSRSMPHIHKPTFPQHQHPSTPQPNQPRSHLPRSPPLLHLVVWDTLAEEDTGGQERDPGEVVRWRIRCSLPTSSLTSYLYPPNLRTTMPCTHRFREWLLPYSCILRTGRSATHFSPSSSRLRVAGCHSYCSER